MIKSFGDRLVFGMSPGNSPGRSLSRLRTESAGVGRWKIRSQAELTDRFVEQWHQIGAPEGLDDMLPEPGRLALR